ncbi:MAG: LptF/LptG family permease [Parachlamydiales bacterium]
MKLWQRYFFYETAKMVAFTTAALYLLFVVIDLSLHSKLLGLVSGDQLLRYYLAQFSKRAALLLPFSLLIAGIKVLTTLTIRGETVALLSSGVPMRRLLSPLLLAATLVILSLYANEELLYPRATRAIERFEGHYLRHKGGEPGLYQIALADGSTLLYAKREGDRLHDLFWIRGPKEIVHIEELELGGSPIGLNVDYLQRGAQGALTLAKRAPRAPLEGLPLAHGKLPKPLAPPDQLPLLTLARQPRGHTDYGAELATTLHQKLAQPLICLLAILGPAPFCLSFSRQKAVFLIYALSIGLFLSLATLMDAAAILGTHHTLPPAVAIWSPLAALFALIGLRTVRLGSL